MSDLLDTPQAGPAAIRGGAVRVAGYAIGVLLSILAAALLFRHLGVRDSGRYITVLSLVALIGGLTEGGLTALGVREFAARSWEGRAETLRALLGLRIGLTALGVAVAVVFAVAADYGTALVAGTALAGLGLLIQSVQNAATIPLQAVLRFGWVTLADLVRQVVTVAAIIALVLGGAGVVAFLAVGIPAAFASLVATVGIVRERAALVPTFRLRSWAELAREAFPYAITVAVAAIYFRTAVVVMSLVSDDVETGYFGVSFRVIDVLTIVPVLLAGAAFPIFARAARSDRERLRYALERSFEGALIAGTLTAVSLALGADIVVDVVAGSEFAPAVDVLQVQATALLLGFVNAVIGYALLSLSMYRALLTASAAALVSVIVLGSILGAAHGAVGGAAATVVGEAVLALAGGAALLVAHPDLRPSPWRAGRILIAGCTASAVGLLGLPAAAAVAIAALVFAAGLLALRAVPDEIVVELRRMLGRGSARGA